MLVDTTNDSAVRVHSRRTVCTQALLDNYCQQNGLLLGQYAMAREMDYQAYFQQYGLSENAFSYIFSHDADFRDSFNGEDLDVDSAIGSFGERCALVPRWCPQYIHVYETLRELYPRFGWDIDYDKRIVRYSNYPRIDSAEIPTFFDLLTRNVRAESTYVFVKKKKKRKRVRRRRHLSDGCCCY